MNLELTSADLSRQQQAEVRAIVAALLDELMRSGALPVSSRASQILMAVSDAAIAQANRIHAEKLRG